MRTIFTLAFLFVFSTSIFAQFENAQNNPTSNSHKVQLLEKDHLLFKQSQLQQTAYYKTTNAVYRLDSMLEEEYDNGTMLWEPDDLEHIFYDASNTCTNELDFNFSASGRDSSTMSWYTFDANGNFSQDITAYYSNNQWDSTWKVLMSYDASNRYTGMLEYIYNNGQWENYWKSMYTYDGNGHLLLQEYFDWNNNAWEYDYKIEFYNHADGRVSSSVDYYLVGNTLTKDDSLYYDYNASNQLMQRTRYDWDNNQWEIDQRYVYTYDANSYLDSRMSLYYYTSSGWDTSYRYVYNYNAQGYLLDQLEQDWTNGQWENYYKDEFTYDMNYSYPQIAANPYYLDDIDVMYLTVHGYDWDDNTMTWVDDYRETLFWSHTGIGIAESETAHIQVYPNPAADVIHMDLTLDTETTLKLYNLSGQLIIAEAINEQQTTLDVSGYAPGLYVLVFEQDGNTAFKKIILN